MKFICNNIKRVIERERLRQSKNPNRQQNSKTINKDNKEEPHSAQYNKYAKKDSIPMCKAEAKLKPVEAGGHSNQL